MKATWNGAVLAESEDTVVVENNHYFPLSSINNEYFSASTTWRPPSSAGEALTV